MHESGSLIMDDEFNHVKAEILLHSEKQARCKCIPLIYSVLLG